MSVQNSLVNQAKKPKFSVMIQQDTYKNLINNTLGDPKRAQRFVASVSSAVAVNPTLQECDAGTILSGALLGESLNLSPSAQLGQYYLVPFNDNKNGRKVAQFQLGYKGYLQLAMRSGQYKVINVTPIKEGELISCDRINETYVFNPIEDDEVWEQSATIGYYAVFEYHNGFRKALFWSKKKMEAHAIKYSKGYAAKKGYTFWEKDFDSMAMKTMLRQLISKWGIMSTEMQAAMEKDMGVLNENGTVDYVDNLDADPIPQETPPESEQPTVIEANFSDTDADPLG